MTKSYKVTKVVQTLQLIRELFLIECTVWVAGPDSDTGFAKLPSRQFSRFFKLLSAISSYITSAGAGLAAVTVSASHKDSSSVICRLFRIIICWLSLLMFHKIQTKLYSRFFSSLSGGKILIDPNHRNFKKFPPSGNQEFGVRAGKYWMISLIIIMIVCPVQY